MRIVHVLNDLSTFFTHRKSLIDYLVDRGHTVTILVPDHLDRSKIQSMGYDVKGYRLSRKGINPITELLSLWTIFRAFRTIKPDVTHHFTIKPVIYGTIAARLAGIPKILNTITGLGYVFTGDGLLPQILKPLVVALYLLAFTKSRTFVIFQNADDLGEFLNLGIVTKTNSLVIPGSGVNTSKFTPQAETEAPPYIVTLPARMLWDKGVGEFVEAAKMITSTRDDIKFYLVGGLDIQNRMSVSEAKIREWESNGHIKWLGKLDNMLDAYKMSHIVCLPSYREGTPMALLEAAASGRAIVTTDVPGCRIFPKAPKIHLVKSRSPYEISLAITTLIDNPALRKELIDAEIKAVNEYYSSAVVNEQINRLIGSNLPTFVG